MNPLARSWALHCSFCRRSSKEVAKLVGGPGVFICDQCITLSRQILDEDLRRNTLQLDALSPDQLLEMLVPAARAVDQASDALHEHVHVLRKRGMSWTRIGAALGVSRQAAWERFS